MCIHSYESTDWHKTTTYLGGYSNDHGGMQIDVGTWRAHAPRSFPDDPALASPAQQLFVAWKIWLANGRCWGCNGQWPNTARSCGVY
jgi:hypothetical protein